MVDPAEREFIGQLPSVIGGSVTAVEACLMIALLKAVRPKAAFEFGTYLGDTTRLLALNFPTECGVVYTLDLDSTAGVEFSGDDEVLARRAVLAERKLTGLTAEVVQLLGDSYLFDPTPYEGLIGLVFIDGNHALKYVDKDTTNALRMVRSGGPSVVIWHDYGNPPYAELTQYLDTLSQRMPLYHVDETLLVFRLQNVSVPERQVH